MKPIEQIIKEFTETGDEEQLRRDFQEWRNHLAELGVQITTAVERIADLEKKLKALDGMKIDIEDDDP